jgi:hypothetical protein
MPATCAISRNKRFSGEGTCDQGKFPVLKRHRAKESRRTYIVHIFQDFTSLPSSESIRLTFKISLHLRNIEGLIGPSIR